MSNLSVSEIMDEIVRYVISNPVSFTNYSGDGRINSLLNEDAVISSVRNAVVENTKLRHSDITIRKPSCRCWFDFSIEDGNGLFIPVNVKISDMTHYDNLSCKMGIYYALTGIRPNEKKNETSWPEFFDMLSRDMNTATDKDYYFLVVNKNNTEDSFWTSLKSIGELLPNGSNLPFQANWNCGRERVARTHEEASRYILDTLGTSLDKRALPSTSFHEKMDGFLMGAAA